MLLVHIAIGLAAGILVTKFGKGLPPLTVFGIYLVGVAQIILIHFVSEIEDAMARDREENDR